MKRTRMNVVTSLNENYADMAESLLLSLRNHYVGEIVVYLLNHSIRDEVLEEMAAFLKEKCDIELVPIAIGETIFDDFSINFPGRFTIEVFYGIIAPYLIDATVERALWLDADIIIKDDIGDFYHMDFGGKSLVVCRDECEDHPMEVKKWKQRLNICDSHIYFNAGVMLMDFQRIRSKFTLEEVITTCNAYKDRILMLNQDIMNVLFENDVIYVNSKEFNISPLCYRKDFLEGYEDVKIIHYFATPKPWKLFIGVDPKLDYWKIQKQRGRLLQYYIAVGIRFLKLDNVFRFCWNKVRKIKRKIRGKLK